jgi:DNA-binding NtrC family response regulator
MANAANGTDLGTITPDALDALERHHWPGNVRELRNAIERAVVVAEHGTITLDDLPEVMRAASAEDDAVSVMDDVPAADTSARRPGEDFRTCIERLEAEILHHALRDAGWNQTLAAQNLRMPRRTLVYKIRIYRIRKPS